MQRKHFIFWLALILLITPIVYFMARPKPPLLFIFAGQSNMIGYGEFSGLDDELKSPLPNVEYWHPHFEAFSGSPPSYINNFGPEIGFVHHLRRRQKPNPIYILKSGRSGADLHTMWRPNSGISYGMLMTEYHKA